MGEITDGHGKHKPLIRQCFVTANVAMTVVANGCVVGFTAVLLPSLRSPDSHIHATVDEESWIAAALGLTQFLGNLIVTIILDILGRRICHFITVLIVLVSWFMLLLANNVTGLIAARLLQGLSLGMFGFLGSIIIAEMTEPKNRGMYLTSISLSVTTGVLLSHFLGTVFSWQKSTLICSFTSFSSLIMLFYTPESPSWLISKGRFEEAKEIFFWLRGNGEEQETEFEKMVIAQKKARHSSVLNQNLTLKSKTRRLLRYFCETFRKPEFYKPVVIMISLYVMFQFSGINVISSYAIDIIEQLVGLEVDSKMLMVVLDIERLFCNLMAVYLMKITKRRTLLFATGFACILSYFGKAAYVYLKQNDRLPFDSPWIPITLLVLYMLSLNVGISSVPYAVAGEIFPLEYRSLGSGISAFALSVNFFLAVKLFLVLKTSVGLSLTYVFYGSVVVVVLGVVWFLLPETKDRTLQDIEDFFRGYSPGDVAAEPLKEMDEVGMMRQSIHSVNSVQAI